jgi:large subunit ribosomal protein L3
MGALTVTIQNLEVVAVDKENNVILIKGNIPGAKKSLVVIKTSVKNPGKVKETEELVNYTPVVEEVETATETPEVEETATEETEIVSEEN